MRRLIIILAVFFAFVPKAMADVVELSGIYTVQFDNGIIVPEAEADGCEAPHTTMEGTDMCIDPYLATNELGLILYDDSSLDFSFFLSYFNGHSCSMRGRATKSEEGWQYHEVLPADMGECILDIRIEDEDIVLNSPEDTDCRIYYCGMRGHLNYVRFPLVSRTQEAVSPERLDCIGDLEQGCEKAIQQQ